MLKVHFHYVFQSEWKWMTVHTEPVRVEWQTQEVEWDLKRDLQTKRNKERRGKWQGEKVTEGKPRVGLLDGQQAGR